MTEQYTMPSNAMYDVLKSIMDKLTVQESVILKQQVMQETLRGSHQDNYSDLDKKIHDVDMRTGLADRELNKRIDGVAKFANDLDIATDTRVSELFARVTQLEQDLKLVIKTERNKP